MGKHRVCTLRVALSLVVLLVGLGWTRPSLADVLSMGPGLTSLDFVTVGNPVNSPDTRYKTPGFGGVGYTYQVGKYEVTAGQYIAFLNAVAATDTYGLYVSGMDHANSSGGCNIQRTQNPDGTYSYSVPGNYANRPVNMVSWGSAVRFANWLTNGQPTGAQGPGTTETGSYDLNGATTDDALMTVTRRPDARYVIPTENEWYKAAYYDQAMPGGPGYWDYPTRSDAVPSNVLSAAGVSNANFWDSNLNTYTIGSPYERTEVGAFAGSPSPYGTFDQGGNVSEWSDTPAGNGGRRVRGGSFLRAGSEMSAATRSSGAVSGIDDIVGFRVALVPDPCTVGLLAVGALGLLRRRGDQR